MKIDETKLEQLWRKFVEEVRYISLDGKIPLENLAKDFAKFVLLELGKQGVIEETN